MHTLGNHTILFTIFAAAFFTFACTSTETTDGPYFGNGFRNGWADQHSIVLWTRLTQQPEGRFDGQEFLGLTNEEHQQLRRSTNRDSIHAAQIPAGFTLDDMEGACPGAPGEVLLSYFPEKEPENVTETGWAGVDPAMDFTMQWSLDDLQPNTRYRVTIMARADARSVPSDTIAGTFLTPPAADAAEPISFCVVTCHDYIRRDDDGRGHKIYRAMQKLNPDFYVHTGDVEYYDKPFPYAMTEELMRFKWNRLFALPNQRAFFTKTTAYFMKDDHDVLSNDAYPGMTYGTVSFERGLQIFDFEQFPSNEKPYKTIRWGKDLQIWLVEGRNYRSKNTDPDGPGKTIWGQEQKEWFFRTVSESDAAFKILMTSSPILGPDRDRKHDNYSNDNFQYEGDEIRAFLNQQKNFFICTGDRHWQYVTHPEGTNLWEFSAGAGADAHAGGWKQEDRRPEHRFLRVKGGFLTGYVFHEEDLATLKLQHRNVEGKVVHEEVFRTVEE